MKSVVMRTTRLHPGDSDDAERRRQEPPSKRVRLSVEPDNDSRTRGPPAVDTAQAVDDDEDGDLEETAPEKEEGPRSDLYLDTVNRMTLDFDFEKLCSVSLTNINVYGCLVCGKYFQGRGKSSHAYAHSIHDDHHVFINLETQKVYVLPDGYEVHDPSLDDISAVLAPVFTKKQVADLSSPTHHLRPSYDLSSKSYLPGYVGLNNIKRTDYLNVVIHLLAHVPPLRDWMLLFQPTKLLASNPTTPSASGTKSKKLPPSTSSELLNRFAALTKKIWNPRLFKSQVSPHEFLQEVSRASAGKFKITEQGDPVEFLGWLLNKLHADMGGSRKRNSSAIYSIFQGELQVETQEVVVRPDWEGKQKPEFRIDEQGKLQQTPFLFLAVDLPPPPLFQDAVEKNIIPQVSLLSILAKYDGKTVQETTGHLRRYKCQRLPPYVILSIKRFTKNHFVEEKNPTVVNFPLQGVDFSPYLDAPSSDELYDLIGNVVHESTAGTTRDKANTVWKVQLRAERVEDSSNPALADEKWFQLQDLVVEEVQKEMIFLGETVLQVWKKRDKRSSPDVSMS